MSFFDSSRLPVTQTVSAGDQVPLFVQDQGVYMSSSLTTIASYVTSTIQSDAAPADTFYFVDSVDELRTVSKVDFKYVATKGYYSAGSGGSGAYWYDAADVTSADNGFTIIVAIDGGRWKLIIDKPDVKQAGAKGDGVNDDITSIERVVSYLEANDGGQLIFPAGGEYLVSREIVINIDGVHVIGAGSGDKLYTATGTASSIISSALTGAVIRFKKSGCSIKNIAIKATAARTAAARNTTNAAYNAGIRFEAEDTTEITDRVEGFNVENVKVTGQPNDGLIACANIFQSTITDSYFSQNEGTGVVFDSGNRTNRTNKAGAGPVTLNNVVSNFNEGSGFVFGNPYDDPALIVSSLRIVCINCEALNNNCTTTGDLTYEAAEWYIRGDHISTTECAATAKSRAGAANDHIAMITAGRTQTHIGFRALSCTRPVKVHAYTTETTGIIFEGVVVRSMTATEVMEIVGDCTNIEIFCDDIIDIGGTIVTPATINGLRQRRRSVEKRNGSIQASAFASTENYTVADDGVLVLAMTTTGSCGIAIVSANIASASPSIVSFRVGSGAFTALIGGTMTVTTGVLTGTTGVDGAVTFSTDAGNNNIYIENRRGGSANFSITFLGMQNGLPSNGI
jgi:hypothetical protein